LNKDQLFEQIWNKYGKSLYYYIQKILPQETNSADDLFQEVMMKVYANLDKYNNHYNILPWLYRITRNHCVDYLKSKKENLEFDESISIEENHGDFNIETTDLIEKALETLEPLKREIVYLHYFENLKYRQIAEILDLNINSIKTHMKKSKQQLNSFLKGKL
jgi:RNA polymerase sigma factor (sigma-70 family)